MDEKQLEVAEATTNALVENNISLIRAQVRKRDPSFDGRCIECGENIPDRRLDTGATTCLDCQERLERVRAQYAR